MGEVARRPETTLKEKIGNIVYVTYYDRNLKTIVTKAILKNTKEGLGTIVGKVVLHPEDKHDLQLARDLAKAKAMIKISNKMIDVFIDERNFYLGVILDKEDYLRNTQARLERYIAELQRLETTCELESDFWPEDTQSNKGKVSYIIYNTKKDNYDSFTHTKCIIDDSFCNQKFIGIAKHRDPDGFDICIGGRIAFLRAVIKLNKTRIAYTKKLINFYTMDYKNAQKSLDFYNNQNEKYLTQLFEAKVGDSFK